MTSPPRVAVANWSARRVGGVEDYVHGIIHALHGAGSPVAFWHEVDEPADRVRIALPEGVTEMCAGNVGLSAALAALAQWRPDVIYVHGLLDIEIGRHLQAIAPSVAFVHTYTGTCISGRKTLTRPAVVPCDRKFGWPCLAHYFPRGCGGRSPVTMWTDFRRQQAQLDVLRGYRALLTHSGHMQAEMSRHGLRADVVPYPVVGQPAEPDYRSGERWRLLCAARLDVLKGGRVLLDALSEVAARASKPIALTFAGDGPDRAALEARARELRCDALQITLPGWVQYERVVALLKDTDLLVVPSLWPEPFGSIGPLAAQYGVPAAAFDVGGIGTWLTDGVTGHLAPGNPPTSHGLADAVLRCLENEEHLAMLRRGVRAAASRFNMTSHLPALMAAFERAAR